MLYRQTRRFRKSTIVTFVKLRIDGKWVVGRLLDKDGNLLTLPYQVKAGEKYIIEAPAKVKSK
jgi:uncharacterized protein YxjI